MEENTKQSPGCYHSLLKYLSELTGISETKDIIIKDLKGLRNKSGKRLAYRASHITVVDCSGDKHSYMIDNKRFDERGITLDHFLVQIRRPIEEFNIELKFEGNYQDSLEGGWSCTISLFSINNQFFAPSMECAHN